MMSTVSTVSTMSTRVSRHFQALLSSVYKSTTKLLWCLQYLQSLQSLQGFPGFADEGRTQVQCTWEQKWWATWNPAGSGGRKWSETVMHTSMWCITLQVWPPWLGTHHAWVAKAVHECSMLGNVRDELHWALWDLKCEGRSLFFFLVVNTGIYSKEGKWAKETRVH